VENQTTNDYLAQQFDTNKHRKERVCINIRRLPVFGIIGGMDDIYSSREINYFM